MRYPLLVKLVYLGCLTMIGLILIRLSSQYPDINSGLLYTLASMIIWASLCFKALYIDPKKQDKKS